MRILAALETGTWVDHHIVGSLRDLGHEVTVFGYGAAVGEFYGAARRAERRRKNLELLDLARSMVEDERGLHLILCYVYDDFLEVATAQSLAAFGVPMLNLNVDMVNQWYRQSRTARFFTAILCAQRDNMSALAASGASPVYFPMAARLRDAEVAEMADRAIAPTAPVTFVGTPMPFRVRVLRYLVDSGVPIAVYGKFWTERRSATPDLGLEKTMSDLRHYGAVRLRHEGPGVLLGALGRRWRRPVSRDVATLPESCLQGYLPQEDMFPLFARSQINIGFTRMVGDDPWVAGRNQVKLRDFEVPMAGGFYLVERAPHYDELFVPGAEVETWSTPTELREKIEYYLQHNEARSRIAASGRDRARREHSWERRFRDLFCQLRIAA